MFACVLALLQYCLCFVALSISVLALFLGQFRFKSNPYPMLFFLLTSAFARVVALSVFVFVVFSANLVLNVNLTQFCSSYSHPILHLSLLPASLKEAKAPEEASVEALLVRADGACFLKLAGGCRGNAVAG